MRELHLYQQEALQAIRESVWQGVRRLMVEAPTGAGKTLVAAAIVNGALRKNNKTAFVVSSLSLIDQTIEAFAREGITDLGVIQANHFATDWSKPVQICSIDTVRSRGVYPEAKVVVFDEAHRLTKAHVKWLEHTEWKDVPFIGLSATPWARGLGRYFETKLQMGTVQGLIEDGFLSPFRVFATDHPDLSGVKTTAGDYQQDQLSGVMREEKLSANVIESYKTHWNKGKTLVFAVDRAHAKSLQARFHDAGITAGYQDKDTTDLERAEIKRKFHDERYAVVVNVMTLTVGVDWDVRCLILARPTKSEMLYVQIIGRALRTAPGKDRALILDHTDTTSRLGFVTDIQHDRLDDGKPKRAEDGYRAEPKPRLPRPCERCACLLSPGLRQCPSCGLEVVVKSHVSEGRGHLVELDSAWRKPRGNTDRRTYTEQEKFRFYAQLKGHAVLKGYKDGWPAVTYRKKFKAWPPWSWNSAPAMEPGPEVRNYILSRLIAYANQRKQS